MQLLRSRFVALTLGSLLLASTVAAGCGGDDDGSSADATTTTEDAARTEDISDEDAAAIGAKAFEDAEFSVGADVEICVGRAVIGEVGMEQAEQVVSQPDLTKLSEEDQAVAAAALNECVPGEVMATGLVDLFTGGLQSFDTGELSDCLADRLDGKVGDSMLAVAAADDEAWLTQLFGECPTAGLTAAAIAAGLEGEMPPAVAKCVSEKVAETTDFNDFVAADADPEVEAEVQARIEAAVAACPTS